MIAPFFGGLLLGFVFGVLAGAYATGRLFDLDAKDLEDTA